MIAAGRRVAVIPVGASEQHGGHLPVSTDTDIATEVARRVCRSAGYLLMPAVPYGVSFEHAPLFNVSLRAGTLRRVLDDAAASLSSCGARAVFVINGHHGNQRALGGLAGIAPGGARVFALSYWRHMRAAFDHAGRVETSLMLAASGRVRMSRARRGFVEPPMGEAQRARLARLASRSFTSVARNGVWGDPRGATAAEGRRLLAEIAGGVEAECRALLAGRGRAAGGRSRRV